MREVVDTYRQCNHPTLSIVSWCQRRLGLGDVPDGGYRRGSGAASTAGLRDQLRPEMRPRLR